MKNKFVVKGEYTEIFMKTRNGIIVKTVIDTEDLQRIIENRYSISPKWDHIRKTYRAKTKVVVNGKAVLVYLYRFLVNAPDGVMVDHIDHDTLNNRKSNLRLVDNSQNLQNRKGADSDSSSGIRNVWWSKQRRKWCVSFRTKGKHVFCGAYDSIEKAAEVADEKRKTILSFAC